MLAFRYWSQNWTAGGTAFVTSVRVYSAGFAVFKQLFPDGAAQTNLTETRGSNVVSSCWPSVDPKPASNQSFGYVWWGGRAFLEGSVGGEWQPDDHRDGPGIGLGDDGGPFVVFEEDMKDSLVFAPASNFMTNTPGLSPAPGRTPKLRVGAGARGYEIHANSYCVASGDGSHVSFKAEGYNVSACQAKCDAIGCACFDISLKYKSSECRCNLRPPPGGGPNITKSANGLSAFVYCGSVSKSCGGTAPPPPPVPPAPPAPPPLQSDGSVCFGLDAPVSSVPAGYSLESIVFLGTCMGFRAAGCLEGSLESAWVVEHVHSSTQLIKLIASGGAVQALE